MKRSPFLPTRLCLLAGVLVSALCLPAVHGEAAGGGVFHAQGELAGEAGPHSVILQSRLTAIPGPQLDSTGDVPGAEGMACFEWSEESNFAGAQRTAWLTARAESDFILRTTLTGLKPGTLYYYRLVFGKDKAAAQPGPGRQFKTLADPAEARAKVTFCMGSCMNYHAFMRGESNGGGPVTATEEDKRLGYPVFSAMLDLAPDFFIGTGDIVYYDKPASAPARTLPQLHRKWHEQFRFPRLIAFFARTPAYWSKDDHDFRFDDADLTGDKLPAAAEGMDVFREQMPLFPAGDHASPAYRTHRIHRDVQLWFTEGRDFRSPNKTPDGADKSLWGTAQRQWLQRTLKESDAQWKIIISPTPMVGPDDARKKDNHANPGGFRHEAEAFFTWARENAAGPLIIFCGDRHWQYHSIHPSGAEEFSCGALNDENSRHGVPPGSKRGTDPDGLIRQPYLYPAPTGGFLHVTVEPGDNKLPRLHIAHRDDHGTLLYEVTKIPSSK